MILFLLYKCFSCKEHGQTVQNSPNTCYFRGTIWKEKKVCYNLGVALCSRQMSEDAKQNGKEPWLKLKRRHQSRKTRSLKLNQQKRGQNALCLTFEKSLNEFLNRTHTFYWLFGKAECKWPNAAPGICLTWVHEDDKFTKHKPAHFCEFLVFKSAPYLSPKYTLPKILSVSTQTKKWQ